MSPENPSHNPEEVINSPEASKDAEKEKIAQLERYILEMVDKTELESKEDMEKSVEKVTDILKTESADIRPRDDKDRPGGLVELKKDIPTIIIPDLHARRDYLAKALMERDKDGRTNLDKMVKGELQIVCLGDGMHWEGKGADKKWDIILTEYLTNKFAQHLSTPHMDEEMIQDFGVMHMVLRIKEQCPEFFHYLKGNHDNITNRDEGGDQPFKKFDDIVGEGELVKQYVRNKYGPDFLSNYAEFEQNLPVIAVGNNFIASHTQPDLDYSKEQIVNYRDNPNVTKGLTWTRSRDLTKSPYQDVLKQTGKQFYIQGHEHTYSLRKGSVIGASDADLLIIDDADKMLRVLLPSDGKIDFTKNVQDISAAELVVDKEPLPAPTKADQAPETAPKDQQEETEIKASPEQIKQRLKTLKIKAEGYSSVFDTILNSERSQGVSEEKWYEIQESVKKFKIAAQGIAQSVAQKQAETAMPDFDYTDPQLIEQIENQEQTLQQIYESLQNILNYLNDPAAHSEIPEQSTVVAEQLTPETVDVLESQDQQILDTNQAEAQPSPEAEKLDSNPRRDLNCMRLTETFKNNADQLKQELQKVIFSESRSWLLADEQIDQLKVKGLTEGLDVRAIKEVKENVIKLVQELGQNGANKNALIASVVSKIGFTDKKIVEDIYEKVNDNVNKAVAKRLQEETADKGLKKWLPAAARVVSYGAAGALTVSTGGLGLGLGLAGVRIADKIISSLWGRHKKRKKETEMRQAFTLAAEDDLRKSQDDLIQTIQQGTKEERKKARDIIMRREFIKDFAAAIAVAKQKQINEKTGHSVELTAGISSDARKAEVAAQSKVWLEERYPDLSSENKEQLARAMANLDQLDVENNQLEKELEQKFGKRGLGKFLEKISKGIDKISDFATGKTAKSKMASAAFYILGGTLIRTKSILTKMQAASENLPGGLTQKFAQSGAGQWLTQHEALSGVLSDSFTVLGGIAAGEGIAKLAFSRTQSGKLLRDLQNTNQRLDDILEGKITDRNGPDGIIQRIAEANKRLLMTKEWKQARRAESVSNLGNIDTEYAQISQKLDQLNQEQVLDNTARQNDQLQQELEDSGEFDFIDAFLKKTGEVAKDERTAMRKEQAYKWIGRAMGVAGAFGLRSGLGHASKALAATLESRRHARGGSQNYADDLTKSNFKTSPKTGGILEKAGKSDGGSPELAPKTVYEITFGKGHNAPESAAAELYQKLGIAPDHNQAHIEAARQMVFQQVVADKEKYQGIYNDLAKAAEDKGLDFSNPQNLKHQDITELMSQVKKSDFNRIYQNEVDNLVHSGDKLQVDRNGWITYEKRGHIQAIRHAEHGDDNIKYRAPVLKHKAEIERPVIDLGSAKRPAPDIGSLELDHKNEDLYKGTAPLKDTVEIPRPEPPAPEIDSAHPPAFAKLATDFAEPKNQILTESRADSLPQAIDKIPGERVSLGSQGDLEKRAQIIQELTKDSLRSRLMPPEMKAGNIEDGIKEFAKTYDEFNKIGNPDRMASLFYQYVESKGIDHAELNNLHQRIQEFAYLADQDSVASVGADWRPINLEFLRQGKLMDIVVNIRKVANGYQLDLNGDGRPEKLGALQEQIRGLKGIWHGYDDLLQSDKSLAKTKVIDSQDKI
ncbi:MAG: hypothetical protein ABH896_04000, partial [Candidatus Jacksonbacteria bacterium]